jgi:cobalt-zinc-cadmium efflux system protein
MSAGHSHGAAGAESERNLRIALGLTATYMIAEIVGGLVTGSLALLSDAAHMFTDVMALAISLAAIRIGRRPADRKRTFGYYRFEILAAVVNAVVLFGVGLYILVEAYERFRSPPEVQTGGMLAVAVIGLIVNFVAIRLLQAGSEESLNVKGAYLEVWSDLLGSIGVIAAALIIRFTGWTLADPVVAVAIGLWVLPRTWILLSQSINILLEGVPEGLALDEIDAALASIPGVKNVHDLHAWAITSGKTSLTAHLVIDPGESEAQRVQQAAAQVLEERFLISHSTVQVETVACTPGSPVCMLHPTGAAP